MTAWTAAHQASLSIANAWSLLKPMSVESVMSSNHLILYHPFLLLPSIFPSIRVFSNESVLYHLAKVLMGRAMFGKSLTQFSTDGRGCVPSVLLDLRPNYGAGNEDSSVQFSRSVVSDSLRPHESQHARPPYSSPSPGVHSNSHPLSQ